MYFPTRKRGGHCGVVRRRVAFGASGISMNGMWLTEGAAGAAGPVLQMATRVADGLVGANGGAGRRVIR